MATGQPSAAVSATTGKARIHGLDKGVGGGTDEDEINITIRFSDDKPMKPVGGKKAEPIEAKFRHVE